MIEKQIIKEIYNKVGKNEELAKGIYDKYQENSLAIINEKQYLLGYFPKIDINIVRIMIKKNSLNIDRDTIAFAILYELNINAKNGDVFTYLDDLDFRIKKITTKAIDEKGKKETLNFLEGINEVIVFEDYNKKICVYLKHLYDAEVQLVDRIKTLIKINESGIEEERVNEFINNYSQINLNKEQKKAVKIVLSGKVSLLTGMAGTGKTTTLKAIVEGFNELLIKPDIKLVSLSGKAVRRASEVIGIEGETIHGLLRLREGKNVKANKVKADILIIDESSMVDLELFNLLLNALNDDCIVVIAGDYRQLPSIGPGAVFKDLIGSKKIPVAELKQIERQSGISQIVKNSHKIVSGIGFLGEKGNILSKKIGEFEFIEADAKSIIDKVKNVINMAIYKGKHINDIQVIAPQKQGDNGVDNLNFVIADEFNKANGRGINKFAILDCVVQIKNNYDKKVFNGEKGIVTRIEWDNFTGMETMKVNFGKLEIEYKGNEIEYLELAYCLTVHKMQGSESKIVIVVVDKSCKNLSRELLYVAISRAKERVVIIGDKEAFNAGVKKTSGERNSNLLLRLN